jgi:ABC-2 type transport system permease protein
MGALNPFGRGGFFWLLAFETKLAWRGFWSSGKMGPWTRLAVFAAIAVGAGALGFGGAVLLAELSPSPSPTPIGVLMFTLAIGLTATLMVSQALLASVELVYTRGDLDLLFSSPLHPWTVMMARATAIVVNVATVYLLLAGAVLIWTPLTGAAGWWVVAPSILALALLSTGVGLLLARGLFAWIGPRNTRVAAQILAALIGASIFLVTQSVNFLPRSERDAYWRAMAEQLLAAEVDVAHPIWLPARAALGDGPALALFFGAGLMMFLLAAFWFSRSFVADAAAVSAMGARKRPAPARLSMEAGATAAIVRKEWRLLRRDPLLLSQIGLQIVYLLPLIFLIWSAAGRGAAEAGWLNAALGGGFVLFASSLAGSLTWITASAEEAPDLLAAAPLAKPRIETGKLIAASTPAIAVMLIPAIAIGVTEPVDAVYVILACAGAAISASLVGIWHQVPASRKDFRKQRSTSWVVGLGQTFVAMSWSGAAGLAIAGLEALTFIPIVIAIGVTLALQDSKPKAAV